MRGDAGDPQTWNGYAYVGNNPLSASSGVSRCPRAPRGDIALSEAELRELRHYSISEPRISSESVHSSCSSCLYR